MDRPGAVVVVDSDEAPPPPSAQSPTDPDARWVTFADGEALLERLCGPRPTLVIVEVELPASRHARCPSRHPRLVPDDRAPAEAVLPFDVGPYGEVWLANAERLAVDLASIDVLFLSHWHWDHSGGITTVVAAIATARDNAGRTPLVVDVHPDRPDQRGILTPLDVFAMLPPEPTLEAIETVGGNVVSHADVHGTRYMLNAS